MSSTHLCLLILSIIQSVQASKELVHIWSGLGWERQLVISSPDDRTSLHLLSQISALLSWIPLNRNASANSECKEIKFHLVGIDGVTVIASQTQSGRVEKEVLFVTSCFLGLLYPFRLLIVTSEGQMWKHKLGKAGILAGLYLYDTQMKQLWSLLSLARQEQLIQNKIETEDKDKFSVEKYNLQGMMIFYYFSVKDL